MTVLKEQNFIEQLLLSVAVVAVLEFMVPTISFLGTRD